MNDGVASFAGLLLPYNLYVSLVQKGEVHVSTYLGTS